MKILITGATGFIGSHLAQELVKNGHELTLLVLKKSEVIDDLRSSDRVRIFETNILDDPEINVYLKDVKVVFHLAAIRHRWGVSPEDYLGVNTGLTRTLLEASKGTDVKQFIFCSSVSVFGWPKRYPINERFPYCPNNSYGESKVECEKLVKDFCIKNTISYTIVRPSMTFGDRDYTGFVTKFISLVSSGKYLRVGSGRNHIQLVSVDDLVDGFVRTLDNARAKNEDFIITNAEPLTVRQIENIISEIVNKKIKKVAIPNFLAYIPAIVLEIIYKFGLRLTGDEPIITREKIDLMTVDRSYSIKKAERLLKYHPKTKIKRGIEEVYIWNKKNGLA